VFFIASFALVPHQSAEHLGVEILLIGVVSLIGQTISQTRYVRMHPGHPVSWLVTRIVMSLVATAPLCASGLMLLASSEAWAAALVIGVVLSFIAGVTGAWVLLIEIMR
jgi:hypothetical protein